MWGFNKKFNAVSVRERSGVDVVCNLGWFNGRAEVVLDPTMLLDLKTMSNLLYLPMKIMWWLIFLIWMKIKNVG